MAIGCEAMYARIFALVLSFGLAKYFSISEFMLFPKFSLVFVFFSATSY